MTHANKPIMSPIQWVKVQQNSLIMHLLLLIVNLGILLKQKAAFDVCDFELQSLK